VPRAVAGRARTALPWWSADHSGGATAQSDFSALRGVTFAAMGLSGTLVERFGSYAYLAMSLVAALGFVIVLAGRQAWREADRA